MKKILFIPFTPSLAHMTRCLSIAEELKKSDNECLFAIGEEGKDLIEKAGFKIRIVPEINSKTFKSDSTWRWLTKEYFLNNIRTEIKIIEEFKPDVIIFDFRFTSAISAKVRKVKSIGIVHGTALHIVQNTKESAKDLLSLSGEKLPRTLRNTVFNFLFPQIYNWFLKKPINKIKPILKEYKIWNINTLFDLMLGDSTFIADIPELIPEKVMVNNSLPIVGPLLWSGWDDSNGFDFSVFDERSIIYLTMGSTVEAASTINKLIMALKDLPYNVIVSKGSLQLGITDIPENIRLFSYVPGNALAAKSILVIHHGGHETLMQVVNSGTPSLVIPINPDQMLIAKQIKKIGIGNYIRNPNDFPITKEPLNNISVNMIKKIIVDIIQDKTCKAKCLNLMKTMNEFIESKNYLKHILD